MQVRHNISLDDEVSKELETMAKEYGRWNTEAMEKTPHHRIILDLDSSESPVHGEQWIKEGRVVLFTMAFQN